MKHWKYKKKLSRCEKELKKGLFKEYQRFKSRKGSWITREEYRIHNFRLFAESTPFDLSEIAYLNNQLGGFANNSVRERYGDLIMPVPSPRPMVGII